VIDRMSGQSRGFGFVEYASEADAQRAMRRHERRRARWPFSSTSTSLVREAATAAVAVTAAVVVGGGGRARIATAVAAAAVVEGSAGDCLGAATRGALVPRAATCLVRRIHRVSEGGRARGNGSISCSTAARVSGY
jgi:hypothetical protein